ncbi:MAG: hypothetical protein B7Y80_00185 [Hyphomicrobium sp. 32-62-53]|nr:MAG: hypothetical protein B7Z29_13505 [Hyphomicrobium sp. 12-62-95]OYY01780.1 MAG: hypothetical protein B7Y80_00185 [Hyphomicrobium sp. 32-62-53]
MACVIIGLGLTPLGAMATEPDVQAVEPGIEAEVEQCRKDCIETTCAPQFRSCVNSSGEASQTCKTLREDCEKRCVDVDCMT